MLLAVVGVGFGGAVAVSCCCAVNKSGFVDATAFCGEEVEPLSGGSGVLAVSCCVLLLLLEMGFVGLGWWRWMRFRCVLRGLLFVLLEMSLLSQVFLLLGGRLLCAAVAVAVLLLLLSQGRLPQGVVCCCCRCGAALRRRLCCSAVWVELAPCMACAALNKGGDTQGAALHCL